MGPIVTTAPRSESESPTGTVDAQVRLTELHRGYGRVLRGFLGGFTAASRQSAEDLVQETMIRGWRHLDSLPTEPEKARRWLFTVARNGGIDAVRRAHARPVVVDLPGDVPAPDTDDTTDSVVALETLRVAFRAL